MRFLTFELGGDTGLAVEVSPGNYRGVLQPGVDFSCDLLDVLRAEPSSLKGVYNKVLEEGFAVDMQLARYVPPISKPGKIIFVGLNYVDHSVESGFKQPIFPSIFGRFSSSLIGHQEPLIKPVVSEQLDYEGEIAAVIGRRGRHIPKEKALDHVAGYSLFNDASVRDYQMKSPQWTIGKNFDGTGAFGPVLVTADELPPGCRGLSLLTRLNGVVVQQASTNDMVFDVATIVSLVSAAITLEPGDVVVTGTPAGVGMARNPPLYMKHGDVCEVEVEGLGLLRNTVLNECKPGEVR